MSGVLVAGLLAGAFWLLLWLPGGSAGLPAEARRPLGSARGFGRRDGSGQGSLQPTGIADPALMLDLVAAMLDAGQSLLPALGVLADVVDPGTAVCLRRVQSALALGAPWAAAWDLAEPEPVLAALDSSGPRTFRIPRRRGSVRPTAPAAQLRAALTFVATTGAPSAAVLLAEAAQMRRRRAREAERRAAALGVRLVVPLGLCALPAFVALTVVPLLLSLLPAFP